MGAIALERVTQAYRDAAGSVVEVLNGIDLAVAPGEFVAIIGPNGCGKSTLLYVIAGLVPYDQGEVKIDGAPVSRARIGFAFQDSGGSLCPWLKNIDNIGLSLLCERLGRRETHARVRQFVEDMGIPELPLERFPYQCSGGQQQLVALARELIYRPDVLLMDEPFAALDFDRRVAQQQHLLRLWERTRPTVVFVSHDIEEAIFLADRVVLLSSKPARVARVFDVPLARPRTLAMLELESFFEARVSVLRGFREVLNR